MAPRKCQIAASKPNRNSSWGLGKSHGKAAGRVLRLLRGAGNVPDGSFEAQYLDDRRGCYVDSVA